MAVPIFETFTVTDSGFGTSSVVPKPAGTVENDILVIIVSLDGNAGDPISSGFTQFGYVSQGAIEHAYLIKRAGSSESANYTVTWMGNERARISVIRVSGCPITGTALDQVDEISAETTGTATSALVPAIFSSIVDTLAIAVVTVDGTGIQSGDGLSDAQGYVDEGIAGNNGATGAGQMIASKNLPTMGSSLSPTFGWTNSQEFVTSQFNLIGIPTPPTDFPHSQAVIVG